MANECKPPPGTPDGTVFKLRSADGWEIEWMWRTARGRWPTRWKSPRTGISYPSEHMADLGWRIAEPPHE